MYTPSHELQESLVSATEQARAVRRTADKLYGVLLALHRPEGFQRPTEAEVEEVLDEYQKASGGR